MIELSISWAPPNQMPVMTLPTNDCKLINQSILLLADIPQEIALLCSLALKVTNTHYLALVTSIVSTTNGSEAAHADNSVDY